MDFLNHPGSVAEQLADMLLARAVATNDHGRVIGQDHHRAVIDDHGVWLIHELRAEGMPCRLIAEKMDVSLDTVKSISSGRRRGQTATGQRDRCT